MPFEPRSGSTCLLFTASTETTYSVFATRWCGLGFGVSQQDQFVHMCSELVLAFDPA